MMKVTTLQRKLLGVMCAVGFVFVLEVAADLVLGGGLAYAATQGVLGATSMGSILLTVRKTAAAGISGLRDMSVQWTDGDSDITWVNDLCVFSTRASGGYTIKALGAGGASGAFVMSDGAKKLPYNVLWNDGGAKNLSDNGILLKPGVTSPEMTHAATDSANCHGPNAGPTARLMVSIPAANMKVASEGNYSESLTLVVSPN